MKNFRSKACAFMGGTFFMGMINGIVTSDMYLWLPCVFLTLMALVLATIDDEI